MDYLTTVKIDQEPEDCKRLIPPGWLEVVPRTVLPLDYIYDTTSCKFMFHNARKLLHLPFMLKTSTDPRYQFSRLAALEFSRAMIEACQVLRNVERPIVTVRNILDFQTFTAWMIILIDLFGYSQYSSGHDSEQEKKDWMYRHKASTDCLNISHAALLHKPLEFSRIYALLEDVILTCPKTFMGLSFSILERFELDEEKHSHHGKSPYTRINGNWDRN